MLELYLMRHGIAVDREDPKCPVDRLRPLTREGRAKVRAMATAMEALDLGIDLVLSSPLVRSVQTARLVSRVAGFPAPQMETSLRPGGSRRLLMERLASRKGDHSAILLVGHEPDLSALAAKLLTGGDCFAAVFKKGCLCKLLLHSVGDERCATLAWMIPPKIGVRLHTI